MRRKHEKGRGLAHPILIKALFVSTLALCLGTMPTESVRAQQADPRFEIWLHHSIAGIHSSSTTAPTVRLLAPDGSQRALGQVGGQSAEGRWAVDFSPDVDIDQPRVLVRPGDRIEVTIDGETSQRVAPDFEAHANVEKNTIEGQAPPNTNFVGALLHRDPAWFDAPTDYPIKSQIGLGGAFSLDFSGEADIRPGYWAEAVAVDAAGHITVFQLAPPSVTLADTQAYAIVRADAGLAPLLTSRNGIDTELFRSGPAYALGGALYAVLMVHGGNPDFGLHQPEEGERIILLLDGDDPNADPALDEPLPRALGAIDREARSVWGLAPAGSRVTVELDRGAGGSDGRLRFADAAGDYLADFSEGAAIPETASASILVYPGGALARVARARAPSLEVLLYGNQLAGSIPGWGPVEIEHIDVEGRVLARVESLAGPQGDLTAELRDRAGQNTTLAPGDRLHVRPELGRGLELVIPPLRVEANKDRRQLRGRTAADTALSARAYDREPSIFDGQPFDDRFTLLDGRSDAAGDFSLACPTPTCATRYGTLTADLGLARYSLLWIDQPVVGLGVTENVASGRASAGIPLSIAALDDSGQAAGSLQGRSAPLGPSSLPGWDIPLVELYPEGLATGDSLTLEVGADRYAVTVPAFSWEAEVASNTVDGTGPSGRVVAVVAYARGEPDQRPAAAVTTALVGPTGRWSARFPDFDLRAGDDLEIYLFESTDRFLWWSQEAVQGIDPPTATAAPTAEPGPRQTPAPPPASIFLPLLRR